MKKYNLAANYSKELLELIDEDINIVDSVKISEFNSEEYIRDYKELRKKKQIFIHGLIQNLNPGEEFFQDSINLTALKKCLELTDTKYLSTHLQCVVNYGEEVNRNIFFSRCIEDVKYIKSVIGLPIHLENTHFYFPKEGKSQNSKFVCKGEFIKEVLLETDSKFLLDIAHGQIAAWHLNMNTVEYLNTLPLEKVEEIHIVGPIMINEELRDKHGEIDKEGYILLDYVLKNSSVSTVTLEYGGVGEAFAHRSNKEILKRQLIKIREVLKNNEG